MNYLVQHKKQAAYITLLLLAALLAWMLMRPSSVPAHEVVTQDYVPSLLLSGEVVADRSAVLSARNAGAMTSLLH